MKLGVFLSLFADKELGDALDYVAQAGLEAVEVGTKIVKHCDLDELISEDKAADRFKEAFSSRGLTISALSCHGNPVHPDKDAAKQSDARFRKAVLSAQRLGVDTVITFSGCPGESDYSLNPSWVTCPWPDEYLKVLNWQWAEKVIPYWQEAASFASGHGIKVAIEPHPGFVVYNSETALRLRDAVGDNVGVNFDPSHLFWQGMDPAACIRELGQEGAIFHFHAKDTKIHAYNTAANGVLDTKHYGQELTRSWSFRTVGYGHGQETWKEIISALRMVDYDGAISIEHEDSLMSREEGFLKAAAFLQEILIRDAPPKMWWA